MARCCLLPIYCSHWFMQWHRGIDGWANYCQVQHAEVMTGGELWWVSYVTSGERISDLPIKKSLFPGWCFAGISGLIGQGKALGECKAQRLGSGTLFSQGINSSPWLHPYHVECVTYWYLQGQWLRWLWVNAGDICFSDSWTPSFNATYLHATNGNQHFDCLYQIHAMHLISYSLKTI